MDLNSTVSAQRLHIGFFGTVNSGKSSLVNALTGQELSIVSDTRGTTTDPVQKAMELLPLGPVVIIDTPGLDDGTELGRLRIERTMQMLRKTDIAVIVTDTSEKDEETESFIEKVKDKGIPFILVRNKYDLVEADAEGNDVFFVSAKTGENIDELKMRIAASIPAVRAEKRIVSDLLKKGDTVILVTPIDESAPKGRLILPQQQTIRDILDKKCLVMSCTTDKLKDTLCALANPPQLIITDSQVFHTVYEQKPAESRLTSFSVLFAGYKGDIHYYVESTSAIDRLTEQSRVLIAEACTHAPLTEDIGRVKIPHLLRKRTGERLQIDIVSGNDFPEDLSPYNLIIHCGACMFNRKYVLSRIEQARAQQVPMTNYGVAIAHLNGILNKIVY